jgi:hypothetical protein
MTRTENNKSCEKNTAHAVSLILVQGAGFLLSRLSRKGRCEMMTTYRFTRFDDDDRERTVHTIMLPNNGAHEEARKEAQEIADRKATDIFYAESDGLGNWNGKGYAEPRTTEPQPRICAICGEICEGDDAREGRHIECGVEV